MADPNPKHTYGTAALTRSVRFFRYSQLRQGNESMELSEGALVEVRKIEALIDDHNRFDRYWYHIRYGYGWDATVEEYEIGPAGVLDRLASI